MPHTMASYHGPYHLSRAELRKSNKPIMEKRRRARINTCLNELKTLILDAMKKDPARHSKLEKADILEMTVKHLQDIQREQMRSAVATDPSVITKFHSGFSECATEVSRYVSRLDGVDDGVKRRLMGHLNGCVSGLNQVLPLAGSNQNVEDVNNNSNNPSQRLLGGMQLVPSRLPTGELAILIPNMDSRGDGREQMHRSAFRVVSRPSPGVSPAASTTSLDSSDHVTSTSPDLASHHQHHHAAVSPHQMMHPMEMAPPNEPLESPTLSQRALDLKTCSPSVSPCVTEPSLPPQSAPTQLTAPSTSRDMWRPW
ncbi:hypothetical protein GE061_015405 [Apolygus lucorum]|uniref:Uncharacterized protein n=1 Tax=Apolygus lucorum TaxID=248454 RepID=A0A8S9XKZ8_APOLU|nr:hypothetical protein GE061_015405 [Apolygus lucorum]